MLKLPSAQQPQIVDIFTPVCTCSVIPRRRLALLPVLSLVPRLCVCALCYWLSSGNESGALILLKENITSAKSNYKHWPQNHPQKKSSVADIFIPSSVPRLVQPPIPVPVIDSKHEYWLWHKKHSPLHSQHYLVSSSFL